MNTMISHKNHLAEIIVPNCADDYWHNSARVLLTSVSSKMESQGKDTLASIQMLCQAPLSDLADFCHGTPAEMLAANANGLSTIRSMLSDRLKKIGAVAA